MAPGEVTSPHHMCAGSSPEAFPAIGMIAVRVLAVIATLPLLRVMVPDRNEQGDQRREALLGAAGSASRLELDARANADPGGDGLHLGHRRPVLGLAKSQRVVAAPIGAKFLCTRQSVEEPDEAGKGAPDLFLGPVESCQVIGIESAAPFIFTEQFRALRVVALAESRPCDTKRARSRTGGAFGPGCPVGRAALSTRQDGLMAQLRLMGHSGGPSDLHTNMDGKAPFLAANKPLEARRRLAMPRVVNTPAHWRLGVRRRARRLT